jgi:hypothetical protein
LATTQVFFAIGGLFALARCDLGQFRLTGGFGLINTALCIALIGRNALSGLQHRCCHRHD